LWEHKAAAAGALLVLAALGYGLWQAGLFTAAVGKDPATAAVRLEYWRATWQVIGEHPWLGVGPGNFGNAYLRFMPPTAAESIKDPHNFFLDVWSSAGLVAALAVTFALAAFFIRVGRQGVTPPQPAPSAADLGVAPRPQGME